MNITVKEFILAAKSCKFAERMFGLGRPKNYEFRGTYFRNWIFIETFTEFIFAMGRLLKVPNRNNEKIIHVKIIHVHFSHLNYVRYIKLITILSLNLSCTIKSVFIQLCDKN